MSIVLAVKFWEAEDLGRVVSDSSCGNGTRHSQEWLCYWNRAAWIPGGSIFGRCRRSLFHGYGLCGVGGFGAVCCAAGVGYEMSGWGLRAAIYVGAA